MAKTAGQNGNAGSLAAAAREAFIRVRGARMHNLKNVDLDLPRDRFIVLTGPSGSGKSSLAFDTLFAEGQRQYIESLSVYARQFLNQLERPDVDSVLGLPPTVCIDQRPGSANPRSTVATVTEIYDYLRLLYARLGEASCFRCGTAIRQQAPEQIVKNLLAWPEGTKVMLLAPLVRGRKGAQAEAFAAARKAGFVRVRVNGEIYDLDHLPELSPRKTHHVEAVVDRIIIRPAMASRLAESIPLAVKQGEGVVIASRLNEGGDANDPKAWRDFLYSTQYACPSCNTSFSELEPRTFSFNSPYGACPVCEGLGVRMEFDPELVLPDASLSHATGAVAPWKNQDSEAMEARKKELEPFFSLTKLAWETPLEQYTTEQRDLFLRGNEKQFIGLLLLLEKELATELDDERRAELATYRGELPCTTCQGSRLRPEAMSVRVGGRAIHEVARMPASESLAFFQELTFEAQELPIATPLVGEIKKRLDFLLRVGVDYLTLERSADTLSGGELQRVRLASSIGAGLVGVCYVLDEPSIGLHPRDNQRLIDALRALQQQGNTVLVVEHDEAMMRQADYLVDLGPGAGAHGGEIVARGTPAEVAGDANSLTGRYLSGTEAMPVPSERRRVAKTKAIVLEEVTTNNLKNVTVSFPLGVLVCVTGVSGSGKSSLVNETLARALVRKLGGAAPKPGPHARIKGTNQIDKVVAIDQAPLGRSPRSNPATFSGLFDEIRRVFAQTREAKQRGFTASRFSFNNKGGRCEECQGQGLQRIEMNFLPDLYVPCPACHGARFNKQTLAIKYRGLSIADVLNLPVEVARGFFENFPLIHRVLTSLDDVGLGYLPLGQPSTTLSGGEAQRIKLATELARVDTGHTFYLLDEPTTGLHFDDIRRLLGVLQRLVDRGNTVLVIEHNVDVMRAADWLIDLGPEGGAAGGHLLATGTPEELAALAGNATGAALREGKN